MSTQTVTKKRKSAGDATSTAKKVKTGAPAEKSAPLKSVLKKPGDKKVVGTKAKPDKPAASKPAPAKKTASAEKAATSKAAPLAKPSKAEKSPKAEKPSKVEKPAKAVKNTKTVTKEPVVADNGIDTLVEDAVEAGEELNEDQTAALLAGFSSSEDEASGDEDVGVPIEKLPQAPRIGDIQKRIKQASKDNPESTPGVIYLGRIPHGFFEHQMRAYFSQFGDILHIRLARNGKTGKSQHYGFIEFASTAVAEIVAKTMDKYLLFGHILQVRMVPRAQVKENMWNGSGRRKKPAPRNRLEGSKLKRGLVREDWDKKIQAETSRRAEKAAKLKELDYEFEMPALKAVSEVPEKPKQLEDAPAAESVNDTTLVQGDDKAVETVVEITKTVVVEPTSVSITEKTTKKRPSAEVKAKKAKKVKT